MALVGLVGWRGMVGSVLLERMQAENDFALIEPVFFSTSDAGGKVPTFARAQYAISPQNAVERPAALVARLVEHGFEEIRVRGPATTAEQEREQADALRVKLGTLEEIAEALRLQLSYSPADVFIADWVN